ncbi:MAG: sugar ABC transporter substrate-binding protein [Cellulomonadaceae bacterium]|nr:sugar ABC transporter substrate-binding protein [Cellulomonadaceae bacterium]
MNTRYRRGALGVIAAVSATSLVACSSGTADEAAGTTPASDGSPATVDFWGWVPGLEDLVDQWNAENPDINVTFHRMTGDDGTKVEAAVDAGTGPDVVQLSTHSLPDYVIAGRALPITDYVDGVSDLFTASSWASVSFGDDVYGIPQGIGPAGMMYREDIFAQYGIAVPTTWDEYVDAARALHAANPDVYIAGFSPSEIGQWMQEVWQAGGSWYGIDGDTWTVGVNSPESQLVAERWQQLLDEGLVKVTEMWTPEYWAEVNAGTIATISYAAWFPNLLATNVADTSGLWRIAPLPTNAGSTDAGESGGAANIVLKGASDPAAAAEFIIWLNSSEETADALITVGGLFPSTEVGLASDALMAPSEFYGGQVVNEVFADAAAHTPDTWVDGPGFAQTQTGITDGFADVANGTKTFVEVLDEVQADTISRLEASGLNVKAAG